MTPATTGCARKTPWAWLDPRSQVPGGTPSAGLSLGRLRPRRARLRFTRRRQGIQEARRETSATSEKPRSTGVPLNPGGPRLGAEVGPFWMPITKRRLTAGREVSHIQNRARCCGVSPTTTVPGPTLNGRDEDLMTTIRGDDSVLARRRALRSSHELQGDAEAADR